MPVKMKFKNAGVWISNHKATLCHIGAGVAATILLAVGISNCSGKKKAVSERDAAFDRVEKADSINQVMYQRLHDCGNKSDSLTYVIGEKDLVIEDLTNKNDSLRCVNDSLVIANDSLQAGWDKCRGHKPVVKKPVVKKPVVKKPAPKPNPVKPDTVVVRQPIQVEKPVTQGGVTVNINAGANVQTVFGNVTNHFHAAADSVRAVKGTINPADIPEPVSKEVTFRHKFDITIKQDTSRQR